MMIIFCYLLLSYLQIYASQKMIWDTSKQQINTATKNNTTLHIGNICFSCKRVKFINYI